MKKTTIIAAILSICALFPAEAFAEDFFWADEAVTYCQKKNILSGDEHGQLNLGDNITREQMAKMLMETFHADEITDGALSDFSDILQNRWSLKYIVPFQKYMKKTDTSFEPEDTVTREEFAASLVLASGLTEGNIRNRDILSENFTDADRVNKDYRTLLCIAVERGYMKGSEQQLRPQDLLTRAEVCTFLHRVIRVKNGELTILPEDLGVRQSQTAMLGAPQVTVEQAQQWARDKDAADIFVDIAPVYWKYGELTGMRPELLYAQAAKETGFGKYTGAVRPEQNNWAGIKTGTANGDATEDHETFATPDDGVRGHFNHMSAYVGLQPIGEPHARYNSVSKIAWAGTVKTLEGLGGKWCPDQYYGFSILHNFVEPMMQTQVKESAPDEAAQ